MNNRSLLILTCLLAMTGCSKVTGLFNKDEKTPLEGDRISILSLEQSVKPDSNTGGAALQTGEIWVNDIWPQAGGYPSHAMHNLKLGTSSPKLLWKTSIGSGASSKLPLTAQPIIVNNTIYAMDAKSNLRAINAQNGKTFWSKDVSNEEEDDNVITGGLAYAGKTIFITNGSNEVLALSPDDGTQIWRRSLTAPSRAAPSALGGRLFVTTMDNRLFAMNLQNGNVLWDYTGISESAGLLGAASPAVKTDIVVPVFSSGEVSALRVENGSVSWSDNLAAARRYDAGLDSLSDIKAMPIIDNGVIYAISFGGKIAAIDESTGTRIWQRDIGGAETPWVSGNALYFISDENQLIALRREDGAIIWVKDLPRFENPDDRKDKISWAGPIMGSGMLIAAGSNGDVIFVNATSGETEHVLDTGRKTYIQPLIANGTLYILSDDGTLSAYQ